MANSTVASKIPGNSVTAAEINDIVSSINSKIDKEGTKVLSDINFSTAKDAKLTSIASGATVNSTDAELRNRALMTGVQDMSTITGLQGALALKADTSSLASVAFSGLYSSLSGKPTISGSNTGDETNTTILSKIGFTPVPDTRTLTINGTTVDLSQNRSFTIATNVGSVAWGSLTGNITGQSDLQTALNGKANTVHTHTISDVTNLSTSLSGKSDVGHVHVLTDITGLQTALNNKQSTLVSGTDIKTINGVSVLGSGNMVISTAGTVDSTVTSGSSNAVAGGAVFTSLAAKADTSVVTSHTSNVSNPHSVTKAQVGLSNVDNTADLSKPISTATQTAINAKADLSSPAFTGVPTAATAAVGTNTTQLATTAHVFAERSSTATLTNKTINAALNTLSNIPYSALNTTDTQDFGTTLQVYLASLPNYNATSTTIYLAPNFTWATLPTGTVTPVYQNLITYSEQFDDASWTKLTGSTITANTVVAPDSTTTADTYTAGVGVYGGILRKNYLYSNGTYVGSVYLKRNNWNYVGLRVGAGAGTGTELWGTNTPFIDLNTNTVFLAGAPATTAIHADTTIGGGWVRLDVSFTIAASTGNSDYFDICIVDSDGEISTARAGTESVYVWGAQLNTGSLKTYSKTTGTIIP